MPKTKKLPRRIITKRDLVIETIAIADLIRDPNNPRKHSQEQQEALGGSMCEFGFVNPPLVDEHNNILAGHGRTDVAEANGLDSIPCIRIVGLTPDQKKSLALADNKLHDMSSFYLDQVCMILTDLDVAGYNFEVTGFKTADLDVMQQALSTFDPAADPADQMPPAGLPAVSQLGDLWLLGSHRLHCADSLKEESFEKLLGDDRADIILSDAPFNVRINGHVSGLGKARHREFAMASGELSPAEFTTFLTTSMQLLARFSTDGSIHYQFMDWRHVGEIHQAGAAAYTELKNICVWSKNSAGMGSFYRSQHELIFVFKNGTAPHCNNIELGKNGRNRSNIWKYNGLNGFGKDRDALLACHPSVKPTELVADAIRDASKRGGLVLDPFVGSGTTILAAERTRRRAAAIEIDPLYVDTAVRRWEAMTGKAAVLADDGRTFAEIAAERTATQARPDGEGDHD